MPVGAATPVDKIAQEQSLSQAVGRLFSVSENYPELKADSNFQPLQEELASTEIVLPLHASITTTASWLTTPSGKDFLVCCLQAATAFPTSLIGRSTKLQNVQRPSLKF